MRANGSHTKNTQQIGEEVTAFYENLVNNDQLPPINQNYLSSGPCLTDEQKETLIQTVSPEEIKKALFDISNLKAPGPNGYSSGFFKAS